LRIPSLFALWRNHACLTIVVILLEQIKLCFGKGWDQADDSAFPVPLYPEATPLKGGGPVFSLNTDQRPGCVSLKKKRVQTTARLRFIEIYFVKTCKNATHWIAH
jgi:hypothetical protein